jgi:hypothetical protein
MDIWCDSWNSRVKQTWLVSWNPDHTWYSEVGVHLPYYYTTSESRVQWLKEYMTIDPNCMQQNARVHPGYFNFKIHPTLHYFWRLKNLSTYWVDINFEHNTKNWQQPYYLWLNIIRDNIFELSLPCVFLHDYL